MVTSISADEKSWEEPLLIEQKFSGSFSIFSCSSILQNPNRCTHCERARKKKVSQSALLSGTWSSTYTISAMHQKLRLKISLSLPPQLRFKAPCPRAFLSGNRMSTIVILLASLIGIFCFNWKQPEAKKRSQWHLFCYSFPPHKSLQLSKKTFLSKAKIKQRYGFCTSMLSVISAG